MCMNVFRNTTIIIEKKPKKKDSEAIIKNVMRLDEQEKYKIKK